MQRRLQVFISSTFLDLKDERQAAVQAILSAGHIPAGMELFAAGNEPQLETIKRWIDQSDVYLLLLGGRYGSIHESEGISYTEIEYRYAEQSGIPVFAVVGSDVWLDAKVESDGKGVLELNRPDLYKEFRKFVLNKICRFFDDGKDIKISIHETMKDFEDRFDFIGWVPGSSGDQTTKLVAEITALTEENRQLRARPTRALTNGAAIDDLLDALRNDTFDIEIEGKTLNTSAYELFYVYRHLYALGVENRATMSADHEIAFFTLAPRLLIHDLVEDLKITGVRYRRIRLTKFGKKVVAVMQRGSEGS